MSVQVLATTFKRCLSRACTSGAILALALLALAGPAQAVTSDWSANDQGRLRLVSASDTVGPKPDLRLGLHFDLAENWKIYWRSPGEAGFPPEVDWSGSENLAKARILWPVPHRFTLFGLDTFGYGKEVVLPVAAKAADPSKPVRLDAKVAYLTCSDICVPGSAHLTATLPPGAAQPSETAHLIDRFRARVPGHGAEAGLRLQGVRFANIAEGSGAEGSGAEGSGAEGDAAPRLAVTLRADPGLKTPDAVIEGAEGHSFAAPEVTLHDGGVRATLTLTATPETETAPPLKGQRVRLTVFDGGRGLERDITLGDDSAAVPATEGLDTAPSDLETSELEPSDLGASGWATLAGMIGLAVLGGAILNLMPCVLPVLSLKLLSVIEHGGAARRRIRLGFLASSAGILATFALFAAGAVTLKGLGHAVGWGMQFQQPAFLVAMTLIVTLFASNLFGLFEIPLPRFIANAAGRGEAQPGLAGHFATGVLATLLATPCSAPFLGTAVGFALSRGAVEIFAIFLALGVGLAVPYLLVAAVPALAARMPRPGRWMVRVKQVLGVALAATAVWLLTVLAAQRGLAPALTVGLLMLAAVGVIALRGRLARPLVPVAVVLLALGAFAAPAGLGSAAEEQAAESAWAPLAPARIDGLVAEGKVVFVDVTAEWCITCKVNKAAVIDSARVQRLLDAPEVVRMRGDWTERDPAIAAYLATFERYGIPFNAVYGPGAPDGLTLPEVLTRDGVANAVATAR
jgi:suppressor for copper-sensitivity B